MKPRDLPSKWAKILPWYYTGRRQPARKAAKDKHIEREAKS